MKSLQELAAIRDRMIFIIHRQHIFHRSFA